MYLDERGKRILENIVNDPSVTGKELENKLQLSRKQISYSIDKINDYLLLKGFKKIERLKTGKFEVTNQIIDEYKTTDVNYSDSEYVFSEKERLNLIVLIMLYPNEELSTYHFTTVLGISKNTFLIDLKKLQNTLKKEYDLGIIYSRKDGYSVVGSEYTKREILVYVIRKVLEMPFGELTIFKICKLDNKLLNDIKNDVTNIEKLLNIQFTDERLKELPFILYLIISRIKNKNTIETMPEEFQHIIGTKEYSAIAEIANKYGVNSQVERMYITTQIQISNIHYAQFIDSNTEEKLLKAANDTIDEFEKICLVELEEREQLLEALIQHCKPAFYRIKYGLHIENSIVDMVLPQHSYLHEMVKKAIKPFEKLIGSTISDKELVYITVLFGGWLHRQGDLEIIEKKKKVIVVCTNGISVSNFLFVTLKSLFPEFEFVCCLSTRGFDSYEEEYDLVFSTVKLNTEKLQFVVQPFLDEVTKQRFREKVISTLTGKNIHEVRISSLMEIIERNANVISKKDLLNELKYYISGKTDAEEGFVENANVPGVSLMQLLTQDKIIIEENELTWQEAIRKVAHPILLSNQIEERYVEKIISNIIEDEPYLLIAEGLIIAHAGVDDGVNDVAMSLIRLPKKISINNYLEADIIVMLATPRKDIHLKALYEFVGISESKSIMKGIRAAKTAKEILEKISNKGEKNVRNT